MTGGEAQALIMTNDAPKSLTKSNLKLITTSLHDNCRMYIYGLQPNMLGC